MSCLLYTSKIEMIVDGGPVGIGVESTIIDVTGSVPLILRPGAITREMASKVLGFEIGLDPAITGNGPMRADVRPKDVYKRQSLPGPRLSALSLSHRKNLPRFIGITGMTKQSAVILPLSVIFTRLMIITGR